MKDGQETVLVKGVMGNLYEPDNERADVHI